MPRGIELDQEGRYHLRAQAAGPVGDYPLLEEAAACKLTEIIVHFTSLYFCLTAALEVMGSHYHLCCLFQAFRELSREELVKLAERFYPGVYRPHLAWGEREWARFNRRLFNVSELMRNIQQAFTRWFNQRRRRKGPFWAGRFRSTESAGLFETACYVELNAVRARLAELPEQWRWSSAWMRKNGQAEWLMPLERLVETSDPTLADKLYWTSLYWRGTRPGKEADALIPVEFAERMEREKFGRGCYLARCDSFSRGGAIGGREEVAAQIGKFRDKGVYRRRRHPIPVGVGNLYALREARDCRLRL
jgi:hypothetical protein